ncbi:MAG: hypothetical protein OHK0013_30910 [Sandaracinaceae bacterium]
MTGMGEACSGTGNECCGGTCTDVRSAVGNCGSCGNDCATTVLNAVEICSASMCGYASCDPGFGDCDGIRANGCEAPLNTIVNCGRCGEICDEMPGGRCVSGMCRYP